MSAKTKGSSTRQPHKSQRKLVGAKRKGRPARAVDLDKDSNVSYPLVAELCRDVQVLLDDYDKLASEVKAVRRALFALLQPDNANPEAVQAVIKAMLNDHRPMNDRPTGARSSVANALASFGTQGSLAVASQDVAVSDHAMPVSEAPKASPKKVEDLPLKTGNVHPIRVGVVDDLKAVAVANEDTLEEPHRTGSEGVEVVVEQVVSSSPDYEDSVLAHAKLTEVVKLRDDMTRRKHGGMSYVELVEYRRQNQMNANHVNVISGEVSYVSPSLIDNTGYTEMNRTARLLDRRDRASFSSMMKHDTNAYQYAHGMCISWLIKDGMPKRRKRAAERAKRERITNLRVWEQGRAAAYRHVVQTGASAPSTNVFDIRSKVRAFGANHPTIGALLRGGKKSLEWLGLRRSSTITPQDYAAVAPPTVSPPVEKSASPTHIKAAEFTPSTGDDWRNDVRLGLKAAVRNGAGY